MHGGLKSVQRDQLVRGRSYRKPSKWHDWITNKTAPRPARMGGKTATPVTGRTAAEAGRLLPQGSEPAAGVFGPITLGAASKEFLDERRDRSLTDNTMTMYLNTLKSLASFLGIEKPVEDITLDDLRAYMRDQREQGMSDKTLATRRQNIRAFFSFLSEEEFIATDPSVRIAKIRLEKKKRTPMTVEEVQAVLNAFDASTELGLRNRVLFLLMADTGARVTEIVTIELANVDLDMRKIKTMGKGREERYLNLCAHTAREIRRYLRKFVAKRAEPSPYLFPNPEGKPISRHAANKIVKRAAEAAGIDNVCPHRIRATFGSIYADDGGDTFALQQEMGHHDIRTTMGYVTVQEKEVHQKHSRYGLGPKLSLRKKATRTQED